jgi:hypothetical protein
MVWILLWDIFSDSGSLFYCMEISKSWNVEGPGNCVNHNALNYAISGFNILNGFGIAGYSHILSKEFADCREATRCAAVCFSLWVPVSWEKNSNS